MKKLLVLSMALAMSVSCVAAVIDVNWDGSGDYTTIQAGIDDANDGDTVVVADGTYTGDGNRDIDFLGKAITVRSENGASNCIIDCQGSEAEPHRGFIFQSDEGPDSILQGVTITNGFTDECGAWVMGTGGGGAILCSYSSPTITHCIIKGNTAQQNGCCADCGTRAAPFGGGITCNHSNAKIINCIFEGNVADHPVWEGEGNGGAFSSNNGGEYVAEIINCTFYNNYAGSTGGAIASWGNLTKISNCIIWGNEPQSDAGIIHCHFYCGFDAQADFCLLQGLSDIIGQGNIVADPCFANPENGDFHLLCTSPCIDAGDPDYIVDPNEIDMDGEPRVMNGRIDMGADEVDPNGLEASAIVISATDYEFTALKNGPNPDDQILQVVNPCGGTLRWQIEEECDWLEVSPANGTSEGEPNDVIISVDIAGLDWGSYNCELTVTDPNAINNPRTIGVALDVLGPIIELSGSDFEFSANEAGPNPADQTLTIRNSGAFTLDWQISEDCEWLSVNPTSGSSTGEPDDAILSIDTSGLSGGTYNCELTVSDPEAINNPQTVNVSLDVFGAALELSQSQFAFSALEGGPNPADKILSISNSAGGTLYWHVTEECAWLSANPAGGSSTGEPDAVTLSVDISGLDNGDYECELTAYDPNAVNSPQIVNVSLDVIGPTIWRSNSQIGFSIEEGGPNPPDQALNIRNTGGGTLYWKITEDCDWLGVNPTSGTSTGELDAVTLSVDANEMESGDYNCQMTISDPNAENSPRSVQVLLDVFLDCYPQDGYHRDYWIQFGRPQCWCYQYNCKGDTDNIGTGFGNNKKWVVLADLQLLSDSLAKRQDDVTLPANYQCANFDRLGTGFGNGKKWVILGDLNILASGLAKPVSDPHFTAAEPYPFLCPGW
jgi:hypothetical protein